MDQRHKYKTETMKFIEENTSETLFDINHRFFCLYLSLKKRQRLSQTSKKLKEFITTKQILQPTLKEITSINKQNCKRKNLTGKGKPGEKLVN